jgi:hypothetical protein
MALLQKSYLGATPLFRNTAWFEDKAFTIVDATNNVSGLAADATANTKGAWTELIAATSANASFLAMVLTCTQNAANNAALLDIGIGASGAETIVAENIAIGGSSGLPIAFPLKIPSGSRLAARMQSVVGSKSGIIEIVIVDSGDYATAPTSVDVIGGNVANSQGISFSGASGTWTEGVASTSQIYRGVALITSSHTDTAAATTGIFEIATGASGSEQSFGSLRAQHTAAETVLLRNPFNNVFGKSIPAGTRLSVKHPFAADPSKYGFCLIGIP